VNEQTIQSQRNSSIELLRILCIVFIIFHHYSVHGGFSFSDEYPVSNKIYVDIVALGGKFGVNAFILISGYFLIDQEIRISKLITLYLEVFFYSVAISGILSLVGSVPVSSRLILETFFPITAQAYWFATTYFFLYVISPYLNVIINNVDRGKHGTLLLVFFLFWCLLPTFTVVPPVYSDFGFFVFLYLVAGYIKRYPRFFSNNGRNIIISLASLLISICAASVFNILGLKNAAYMEYAEFLVPGNRLPIFFCSVFTFCLFLNIRPRQNRIINEIAKTTFGIYLIHDNRFLRPIIWQGIFRNNAYSESPYLAIHATVAVSIVFVVCSSIDYLRIIFIERPISAVIKRWVRH